MTTWLIDARTLASRPTGIGMYAARHIVRLMREEKDARFVLVCDVKESAEIRALEEAGCEVRSYGNRVFNSLGIIGYFRFLKRVLGEVRADVFWQPNNLQPFRPAGVKRVIVTIHDVFGLGWSRRYWFWHLYYRLNFRRTLRNVTEIWFNSRETENNVRAVASHRLKQLVTKVVYPLTVVPDKTTIKPYSHKRAYFLYLGNIEIRKGADILIEAYHQYRAAGGTADLIFAGPPKNVQVPQTQGIHVVGYVDRETKFSMMCSSLALIVPSRAEGYGMQVAEAAALDVRCLSSDLSVFCEIDANNRKVFPSGDAASLSRLMLEESL